MYISLCVITKNEEDNIKKCLGHLDGIVNEKIVVDTGSTDQTVEIAKSMRAKVYDFAWIDDFSAARNFALEKAKGDWIVFLDADEYFDDASLKKIKGLIKTADKNIRVEGIRSEMINITKTGKLISSAKNMSPRIYRNIKKIRYVGKIHEELRNIRTNAGLKVLDYSDEIIIMHTGYDVGVVAQKGKSKRNIDMLKKELELRPDDEMLNFYVGEAILLNLNQENSDEAIYFFRKAIDCEPNGKIEGIKQKSYKSIMMSMLYRPSTEMKEIFDEAIKFEISYPDYYMHMGEKYWNENNVASASKCFEDCVKYCDGYNKIYESYAVSNIYEIYDKLLLCYILLKDKHKTVQTTVVLLKANKYNYENLVVLIKTLLTQEREENIIAFLGKLYDYDNFADKIYLIKAGEKCDNELIVNFYKSLLTAEELKRIDKDDTIS